MTVSTSDTNYMWNAFKKGNKYRKEYWGSRNSTMDGQLN